MSGEPLDLDAIEARANAATKVPWRSTWNDPDQSLSDTSSGLDEVTIESVAIGLENYQRFVVGLLWYDGHRTGCSEPNAEFIAHARTDVPALVAELRAARARITALEATIAASETVEMLRAALPRDV